MKTRTKLTGSNLTTECTPSHPRNVADKDVLRFLEYDAVRSTPDSALSYSRAHRRHLSCQALCFQEMDARPSSPPWLSTRRWAFAASMSSVLGDPMNEYIDIPLRFLHLDGARDRRRAVVMLLQRVRRARQWSGLCRIQLRNRARTPRSTLPDIVDVDKKKDRG